MSRIEWIGGKYDRCWLFDSTSSSSSIRGQCKICCLIPSVRCLVCVNLILHKISAKLTLTSGLCKMINTLLTPALDSSLWHVIRRPPPFHWSHLYAIAALQSLLYDLKLLPIVALLLVTYSLLRPPSVVEVWQMANASTFHVISPAMRSWYWRCRTSWSGVIEETLMDRRRGQHPHVVETINCVAAILSAKRNRHHK